MSLILSTVDFVSEVGVAILHARADDQASATTHRFAFADPRAILAEGEADLVAVGVGGVFVFLCFGEGAVLVDALAGVFRDPDGLARLVDFDDRGSFAIGVVEDRSAHADDGGVAAVREEVVHGVALCVV